MPEQQQPTEGDGVHVTLDDGEPAAYTWTIRILYGAVIAMNAWLMWEAVKDHPDVAIARARVVNRVTKIVKPIKDRRLLERKIAFVHWQARDVLNEEAPVDDNP